jgi:hypothetical protein
MKHEKLRKAESDAQLQATPYLVVVVVAVVVVVLTEQDRKIHKRSQ